MTKSLTMIARCDDQNLR